MRIALLVLTIACHAACAAAPTTTHPTTHATTQSNIIRKSDAIDLERIEKDGGESTMWYQLKSKTGGRICFGQLDVFDDKDDVTSTDPVISWVDADDHWSAIKITDDRLRNAGWVSVVSGPASGEIWGVLDHNLDDRMKEIVLVHSTDAGATFDITSIRKPKAIADYGSFAMDRNGHGRLTLYLEATHGRRNDRPGYYHYRTTNGGKTWTTPEYEPDATVPADDVPDDDQPSESPKRIQKV
jgi:hypothetical protein